MATAKQKLLVHYYTDITCTETYGNATKAAIKAGYQPNNAASTASKYLKRPEVIQKLTNIEQEFIRSSQKTREEKRSIAWINYCDAENEKAKEFWWQEVCKLDGDYVTKVESKSQVEMIEQEKEIYAERIREAQSKGFFN